MDTTTVKALRVLEALAASEEPRGVAELGRQVGLTQSNTFRILSTLASQGYVVSHPDAGKYSLSLRLWELGMQAIDRHPVRRVAWPHMKQLFGQINETILISQLDGTDVLYVEKLESDYPVRASARVGARAPSWRTASGGAILAYYPEAEVVKRLEPANLPPERMAELMASLRDFRYRGYATTAGGTRPGVNSVAAPIWARNQNVPIAAISISGPAERFSVERLSALAAAAMNTATRITESLGASQPIFSEGAFPKAAG